jgi:hypothetical protein
VQSCGAWECEVGTASCQSMECFLVGLTVSMQSP